MRRIFLLWFSVGLLWSTIGCQGSKDPSSKEESILFDLIVEVHDYGAQVTQIQLFLPLGIEPEMMNVQNISIVTDNHLPLGTLPSEYQGSRIIESTQWNEERRQLTLYLRYGKDDSFIAPILYWDNDSFRNVVKVISYEIQQEGQDRFRFSQRDIIYPLADKLLFDCDATLAYRHYVPEVKQSSHPLIIWLHGAGEGGDNNASHVLANRGVVAFMEAEHQILLDYPYVLAPQSPTFWMPELTIGSRTLRGERDYTEDIIKLIHNYIEQHADIDPSRIYIGGASMGGYQTWQTLLAAPDLFAAAFPIAQAYKVPEEELTRLQHIPIWLTHASEDNVVSVEFSRHAYQYLKTLGTPVIYSEYEYVEYAGLRYGPHGSWVYLLNNDPVNEDGVDFFTWLAQQRRSVP